MIKTRLTEAEFEQLKLDRDAALDAALGDICEGMGWNKDDVRVHTPHASGCYCDCPTGPCQHEWDGPQVEINGGQGMSVTCSRCGEIAMYHDMRCGP